MGALTKYSSYDLFLREVHKYPVLSKEQEYDLAVKYHDSGDLQAANMLVVSNLRFVLKIAGEYRPYGFPFMDIVQEGTMGLMQAVRKFNPYNGYRLITYAVWWIKARIHNYIMRFWSSVKIGTTQAQRKMFQKLGNAKRKLGTSQSELTEEDIGKIAEHFGVKDTDVIEMETRMSSRDFSLDANINEGKGRLTHLDLVPSDDMDQQQLIEEMENEKFLSRSLSKGMNELNERERQIIENRYLSAPPKKLRELGELFGVSKERIRQIENNALTKIRKCIEYDNEVNINKKSIAGGNING